MADKFKSVKCTVVIDAPPKKVFEAITVANQLAGWWPSAAETDPRPGGKVVLWWTKDTANPTPSNHCATTFSSFKPPHEVTYWSVTFTLEPLGNRTKVTIDDKECPVDDGIISVALTWGALRLNLKSYVERGIDMRASTGFGGPWGA
ncbi:MAG: SRPBCC domain-containing protein [Planctomycetes bacterium]|nr:SRPBCC domain-containing protein [Planctomycetota bacterium]